MAGRGSLTFPTKRLRIFAEPPLSTVSTVSASTGSQLLSGDFDFRGIMKWDFNLCKLDKVILARFFSKHASLWAHGCENEWMSSV